MDISDDFVIPSIGHKHNLDFFPDNLRCIIVGACASGKSILLLNLLLQPGWLAYDNLIIFCKTLCQKEYILLETCLKKGLNKAEIKNCFKYNKVIYEGNRTPEITCEFHSSDETLPEPETLPENKRHILVCDDVLFEKSDKIRKYITIGRHSNISTIYLSQNWFLIDRCTIRQNTNFILSFIQPLKNISYMYSDISPEIPYEEFKLFCQNVWRKKYQFIVVDKTSDPSSGKYRMGLDTFYIPKYIFEE